MMDLSALRPLLLLLCLCGLSLADDILPDGPLDALEGGNATFKTLMKDPEFITITWSLSDQSEITPVATRAGTNLNVAGPYAGRADIDTNGQLTLTGLTVADRGEYSIVIIDKLGNTRAAEIELRVMVPVSDVVIKSSVPEAREMGPVALTCSAKGSFLRFKWFNDSTAITGNDHMKVERTDTTSTLSFPSVYRSDLVGPIFCEAYNTLTSAKSSAFSLNVNSPPGVVTVTVHPSVVAPEQEPTRCPGGAPETQNLALILGLVLVCVNVIITGTILIICCRRRTGRRTGAGGRHNPERENVNVRPESERTYEDLRLQEMEPTYSVLPGGVA